MTPVFTVTREQPQSSSTANIDHIVCATKDDLPYFVSSSPVGKYNKFFKRVLIATPQLVMSANSSESANDRQGQKLPVLLELYLVSQIVQISKFSLHGSLKYPIQKQFETCKTPKHICKANQYANPSYT